jgi:hypothetical protein
MITDNRGMRRIEIISDANSEISIDQMMGSMMSGGNLDSMMNDMINLWTDKEIWDGTEFNSEKFTNMLNLQFEKNRPYFDNLRINQDSAKRVIDMLKNLNPEEIKTMVKEMTELKSKMKSFNFNINTITNDSLTKKHKKVMIIMDQNAMTNDTVTRHDNQVKILVDKREKNDDGSLKDDRNFEITFNNNVTEPIKINLPEIDINKLLPVEIPLPNARDKQGNILKDFSFILWLNLDEVTYDLLPERVRNEVKPEFDALTKTEGAVCGYSPNEDGENYLDVWRTCAGAIEELNASPNPTDGLVNLSFKLKENRNISISVNDVFGKKVQDVVVNRRMNKGEIFESFQLKAPEAGMYLIVVQTNAGEQAVHRIIKK